MPVNTQQIMSDDSLAAHWFQGHDYNRSLAGDSLVDQGESWATAREMGQSGVADHIGGFFDSVAEFLSQVPSFVYVILGVLMAATVAYWLSRSNLLYRDPVLGDDDPADPGDDIHAVNINDELAAARQRHDHRAIVRLVYLHTLRQLDQGHRIAWLIHKTPSQYASEYPLPAFCQMTRHFLRVRYGEFPADEGLCREMDSLALEVEKGGEA